MNILHLTTHLNVGGITSYLLTLSKQLVKRGHKVSIISSGGEMVPAFEAMGVKCLILPIKTKSELSPKIYCALPAAFRYIQNGKMDVIHAHTRVTQVMGYFLQKFSGVGYVATCHGFFRPRFFRRVFPCWGQNTIAISEQVRNHLIEDFRLPSERIALIHNGVDLEDFVPMTAQEQLRKRQDLGLQSEPILGIIARLSDVKGHSVLLEAMPQIVRHFPTVKLLVVGQGKMEDQLKAQVQYLWLEKHVQFFSVVNRTTDFLPTFDIFVMPSLQEGLGLSVMEAQAAGLPVVASRVGGIPSLIEDGVTGVLVDPNRPQELAQAIVDLLRQPDLRQKMGQAAREFIAREFSAEQMAEKTISIYKNLF